MKIGIQMSLSFELAENAVMKAVIGVSTVNVLKFRTPKCLTKRHMQTVQTQIRLLLSLIRVSLFAILLSILRNSCIKSKI